MQKAFRALGDSQIAAHSARFFKTGPGEYAEGDQFLGIRVPVTRAFARQHRDTAIESLFSLLKSKYHEERLLALILLVYRFERGDAADRSSIYASYLDNTAYVNNWDLVDSSAHQIVGAYLAQAKPASHRKDVLNKLAGSQNLWERRIAMIATYHFIKKNDFEDALHIAERLLGDSEDLIHKAVGWMLREIGNRDREVEEAFLLAHYRIMPRTMLRYAIEKFAPDERNAYLQGTR